MSLPSHHPLRLALAGLALTAVGGLATACGADDSADDGAGPSAVDTVTTTATTTATATETETVTSSPTAPSDGSSTATSSSSAPTTPECTADDVELSLDEGGGAAGTDYVKLVMTNTSDAACRSGGYGGVSLVDADGNQVGAAARRNTSAGAAVPFVLIPGAHATATVGIGTAENYPAKTCRPTPATGLKVYVPDETHAKVVELKTTGCAARGVDLLQVQPYQPVR